MSTDPRSALARPSARTALARLFAPGRRRAVAVVVVLLVAGAIVIVVTDPFSGPSTAGAGVTDNEYPTFIATVTSGPISSQQTVSATLGYAGSYSVAIPSGTAASAVTAASQAVTSAEAKVAQDEHTLAEVESTSKPVNKSTLLSARNTVSADETSLNQAKSQLSADEQLGCPVDSAATVTSASDGSSPSSGSPSSGSSSTTTTTTPSGKTGASNAGNTPGGENSHATIGGNTGTEPPASAPDASTGSVDSTTSTTTTLTGTVDPNGADTTYYFEYGTSANYGQTTASTDAGAGSSELSISVPLSGLTPGATYNYRLVAKNSVGTSYGQGATSQTNAAPSATTGSPASATSTSETLAGTVDPNGADTTYYFEWGTSASFGNVTPVTDAGAGSSATSVSATITGLKPTTTYDFALVATNSIGTSVGQTVTFQSAESSCVAERQVISTDTVSLREARDSLEEDELTSNSSVASAEQTLSTDQVSLTSAQQAYATAESSAANPDTTFSTVPSIGEIIKRGASVYSLNGHPVPLLYGTTTPYRALYLGVSDGPDVTELQANLIALGFGSGISASPHFSAATEADVKAWQGSLGVPETGVVALGDIVVEPGSIQVDTVTATAGAAVSPGATVLTATSTARVVSIALDADLQSDVKVGDPVTITLPDNSTTPGRVSFVGTIATTPPSSGGGNTGGGSSPTIVVDITPTDPTATGSYDQAPVEVAITDESVANALIVPVDALLALSSGGYALEVVESGGAHTLVPVSLGIFDDANGTVQVTGSSVAVGQRIVVPNT